MRKQMLVGTAIAIGCGSPVEPDLGDMPLQPVMISGNVQLNGEATVRGDTVVVTLRLHNKGPVLASLEYGACSFAVRGEGAGGAWDNRLPPGSGCIDVAYGMTLTPGETRERPVYLSSIGGLRPPAPPGRYQVSIYYRLSSTGALHRVPAGRLDIPATTP